MAGGLEVKPTSVSVVAQPEKENDASCLNVKVDSIVDETTSASTSKAIAGEYAVEQRVADVCVPCGSKTNPNSEIIGSDAFFEKFARIKKDEDGAEVRIYANGTEKMSKKEKKRLVKKMRKEEEKYSKYRGIPTSQRKNLQHVQRRLREVANLPVDQTELDENWDAYPRSACDYFLKTLDVKYQHHSLTDVHGPASGFDRLASLLCRADKYQEKFLPQEVSLLHKIWWLCRGDFSDVAVLDIGGGNACMCLFASMIFDCFSVCIDYECPPKQLCSELYLDEKLRDEMFARITCDVRSIDFDHLFDLLKSRGKKKIVILAKHLCGCATDMAITFAKKFQAYCLSKVHSSESDGAGADNDALDNTIQTEEPILVSGVAMATCCLHKVDAPEFVHLYSSSADLWRNICKDNEEERIQVVEMFRRHVAWRTTGDSHSAQDRDENKSGSTRLPCMIQMAETFEDCLQSARLRALDNLFPRGDVREVRYIDTARSLQNRCLLASARPLHASQLKQNVQQNEEGKAISTKRQYADSDLEFAENVFAEYLERQCQRAHARFGTLDLKPRGFASTKFDYDGK